MDNFTFLNPTKIVFGKDTENAVGEEVGRYSKKVLLHYGKSSIKKTGLYDRVVVSLKNAGVECVELPDVMPNPRLGLIRDGIEICRKQQIDFILAVGGGSVIDSAKAIAVGVPYGGDVWDFFTDKAIPEKALGIGTILTLPASGSESSPSSVITNEDGWFKRSVSSELIYPKFSILNPELAFTLPPYQIACGVADMFSHLMERYFTNTKYVELTDGLIEATMRTIINNAPLIMKNPKDYDAWAEVMWAGTVAHNNLLSTGRVGDWASHRIEHELSGLYDVAHGAGLAVIFPAWMKYVYKHDLARFVQFATRVWDVEEATGDLEKTVLLGIDQMVEFFKRLNLPVTLKELKVNDEKFNEMADKCINMNNRVVGNFIRLEVNDVLGILQLAK